MTFDPDNFVPPAASIKVFGIGGGGGNAVNTMIRTNIEGVEFTAANTDVQALRFSLAQNKIQIGKELTKGLGAGADPDIGRDAMLEDRHAISEAMAGANMVFVTAGMGGGTGTGGAAIAAQIAREMGALTVGVVTKPFSFEGKRRRKHAEEGIARLKAHVDTLITIPNQRLLQIASPDLSMIDAFRLADNVLVNAVKGISDIINIPGTVNVDFADVKTVMSSMGMALMGIGESEGTDRAKEAAKRAICSPLLEDIDIEGATGILINITAGESVSLVEVNEACSIVQEAAHEDANIIFGAVIDEDIGNLMRVTVIATGFPQDDDLQEDFQEPMHEQKPASSPSMDEFKLEEKMTDLTFNHIETEQDLRENDPVDTKNEQEERQGALSLEGDSPETLAKESSDEMDLKIDAALKIAEKLSKASEKEQDKDDIEVPSFLRQENPDLSLS
ncbi:MAG: cell division protein FtsZ [Pseudobacteriovorax sp.]|nr:cell division protein FtsZ [Pseudobacteriovorax sp.]